MTRDPRRETADEYLERIGWCFHSPLCTSSATCRQKRAAERLHQPLKPRVFEGVQRPAARLDWEE
jgi:hypothetical protein